MSVRGKNVTGNRMRSRLASTAQLLQDQPNSDVLNSQSDQNSRSCQVLMPFGFSLSIAVVKQGGGLVNAYCAVFANTTISTWGLALNDSAHFNGTQSFEVTNEGSSPIEFKLGHSPAGLVYTFDLNSTHPTFSQGPVKLENHHARLQLSLQTLLLPPGATRTVTVDFKLPDCQPDRLGVYSGFITLVSLLSSRWIGSSSWSLSVCVCA